MSATIDTAIAAPAVNPMVHLLRLPSPLHDVRTMCDHALADLDAEEPGQHRIASALEKVTCPICRIIAGDVRGIDLTSGAPSIKAMSIEGNEVNVTIAHALVGVIAEAFVAELDRTGAKNYLEMTFGSATNQESRVIVTLQRPNGKTPHQLKVEAERERDDLRAKLKKAHAALRSMRTSRNAAVSREIAGRKGHR